jgi:hypothetical protein
MFLPLALCLDKAKTDKTMFYTTSIDRIKMLSRMSDINDVTQ